MSFDDPYRFGAPEPVIPPRPSGPTGRELLRATWGLLKQDSSMIWLSLLGSIASLAAMAALFVPGLVISVASHNNAAGIVGGILGVLFATTVGIYFQAALVIGAFQRAEGRVPTFGGVLSEAWTLKRQIFAWALVTVTVGLLIRAVEERLGILGKIIGFLGGIAWAIASFLVVPVLVAERLGPIDSVKQSARLIRQTWGTSLRTTLRFGFIQFALTMIPIVLMSLGIVVLFSADGQAGQATLGALLMLLAVAAIFALSAAFGAVSVYARALIYRYATGRPVPGIEPALFGGAFVGRRRRWRR